MKKAVIYSILLVLAFSAAVSAAPSGLWGQWILSPEYLAGDTLRAVTGRSGKLEGNLSFTEGPFGTSWYNFGESHILVYKGNQEGINLPKEQISIEAWAKTDTNFLQQGIVNYFQDNGSFERGFHIGFSNYQVEAGIATEGNQYLNYIRSAINVNEWYHIVLTYDGKTAKLYVNGKVMVETDRSYGPLIYADSASLVLGAYLDDNEKDHLTGAIREVRIYSRALTEAEVQASKPGIVEEAKQIASTKGNSVVVVLSDGKTINCSLIQVEGDFIVVSLPGNNNNQKIAFRDIVAILPIK